ncbi:MAG: TetR/AcrR family transcriptional regulator [Proteobacteria bacterium]|nr:TetR/AcrR family transcriptional regulator [Pseudomonadota bacterium]
MSLATGLTQAERTERSDQLMLEAAVELINERGTRGTRLKDVGIRAGYSRGLAGQRFGSIENLFAFVLRRVGDEWLDHLMQATRDQTGTEAVSRALDEHYRFCVDAPDHVQTFYTLWFESVSAGSELADHIRSIHRRRHRDVLTWICKDPCIRDEVKADADAIAAQFCSTVIGIVYYWLANPEDLSGTRARHESLKRFMCERLQ